MAQHHGFGSFDDSGDEDQSHARRRSSINIGDEAYRIQCSDLSLVPLPSAALRLCPVLLVAAQGADRSDTILPQPELTAHEARCLVEYLAFLERLQHADQQVVAEQRAGATIARTFDHDATSVLSIDGVHVWEVDWLRRLEDGPYGTTGRMLTHALRLALPRMQKLLCAHAKVRDRGCQYCVAEADHVLQFGVPPRLTACRRRVALACAVWALVNNLVALVGGPLLLHYGALDTVTSVARCCLALVIGIVFWRLCLCGPAILHRRGKWATTWALPRHPLHVAYELIVSIIVWGVASWRLRGDDVQWDTFVAGFLVQWWWPIVVFFAVLRTCNTHSCCEWAAPDSSLARPLQQSMAEFRRLAPPPPSSKPSSWSSDRWSSDRHIWVCLPADALVYMQDGSRRPICNIREGDRVVGVQKQYDSNGGTVRFLVREQRVVRTRQAAGRLLEIRIDDSMATTTKRLVGGTRSALAESPDPGPRPSLPPLAAAAGDDEGVASSNTLWTRALRCTSHHPLLTERGHWVPAGQLCPGDQVMAVVDDSNAARAVRVVGVVSPAGGETDTEVAVWTLTTEPDHCYVANGIVVENKP